MLTNIAILLIALLAIATSQQIKQTENLNEVKEQFATVVDPFTEDFDAFKNIDNNHNQANDSRVNGGQVVKRIVPYQVSLQAYRRNSWRHFCGGSIISANHVLTAAHCVNKMRTEEIHVVVGTLTWKSGGQRHRAAAKRIHPKFSLSPKIINDIAIIKVQPAFNLHRNSIAAISLGTTNRLGERVKVRVTGWGATTPTVSGGLPDRLQELEYQTISNEECARKGFKVTPNEVCALSGRGQGSCMGDSGGPLVTTQSPAQLVGVVSYGTSTCAQGIPDVYSRVSSFLPYITKVINTEIP
ncbi:chymotrypsin-2 [Cochliomyia hominivorax]